MSAKQLGEFEFLISVVGTMLIICKNVTILKCV